MQTQVVTQIAIHVTYNGVTESLDVQQHERVIAVIERAANAFHIRENRHLLALFRQDGTEVNDQQSVLDAGLRAGEVLALRPSRVKGGTE